MLTDFRSIITNAEKGGYAVAAINIYNMETVMGVIEAAEQARSPIILQCYSRLFTSDIAYYTAPIVLAAAKRATVPVCFHIDHGASELEVMRALRYGATGVMIDASALPFDENVVITKRVVDISEHIGVAVEGEIGHVGSVNDEHMDEFTEPDEAAKFVAATGVAALAVLVGNAHGRYKKPPKIDIGRVGDIHAAAKIPLVLHGGSGIPDEQIRLAIKAGIAKINFSTDMCYAFLDAVFETSRDIIAPDLFMKDAVQSVKRFALSKIELLGSAGKA